MAKDSTMPGDNLFLCAVKMWHVNENTRPFSAVEHIPSKRWRMSFKNRVALAPPLPEVGCAEAKWIGDVRYIAHVLLALPNCDMIGRRVSWVTGTMPLPQGGFCAAGRRPCE